MAWTTPRTWVAGELATASMLNTHLRDNLNFLYGGDYGNWTPSLTFDTAGNLTVAYTTRFGLYAKFSKLVVCHGNILTSTFTHTTASGGLRITGLPFPALSTNDVGGGGLLWRGITKAHYTHMTVLVQASGRAVRVRASGTSMYINGSGSGQTPAVSGVTDMPTGGTVQLFFTMTYATPT